MGRRHLWPVSMRGRWRPGVIFSTHLGDQVPHQVFSKNWPGGTVSCCATRKKRFEHEGRGAIFAGRYLYNGKRRARFSVALLVQFCPRTHTSVLFYPSLNLQDQTQPHAPVAIFFSPDDGWMCFLFFFARGLVKGCGGWREPHRGRGSSQGRNRLYLGQRKGAQPGRQPREVGKPWPTAWSTGFEGGRGLFLCGGCCARASYGIVPPTPGCEFRV